MPTTLKSKTVHIRKERQCFCCYRKFPAKTQMHYWAGIYEGDFNSIYNCLTCEQIVELCDDDGDGYPEGYVHEGLDKGQTPEEYLEQLKQRVATKKLK